LNPFLQANVPSSDDVVAVINLLDQVNENIFYFKKTWNKNLKFVSLIKMIALLQMELATEAEDVLSLEEADSYQV
jgi:hypothetical protein